MDLQTVLGLSIVGVAMSFFIQWSKTGLKPMHVKIITIGLAISIGTAYHFLVGTEAWKSIVSILTAASTFYAFFFSGKDDTK